MSYQGSAQLVRLPPVPKAQDAWRAAWQSQLRSFLLTPIERFYPRRGQDDYRGEAARN